MLSKLIFVNGKKPERFGWFLTLKNDFESQILELFDDIFESQRNSNHENIFLELILEQKYLLPVDPCPQNSTTKVTL